MTGPANRARELAVDLAIALGCTMGWPRAARAVLTAGWLVCTAADRLLCREVRRG